MSRNRFEKLMQCIRFANSCDATEDDMTDKLWKLRPWISSLQHNCSQIEQEEYSAVDEIMVPFTGRSALKQYLPGKPTPWGFKLWGQAGTTGLLYEFEVYKGQ